MKYMMSLAFHSARFFVVFRKKSGAELILIKELKTGHGIIKLNPTHKSKAELAVLRLIPTFFIFTTLYIMLKYENK